MSFSPQWEQVYREQSNISIWPWSDLVSYMHRYAKPFSSSTKVLEIGFGAGANIPFFLSIGVDYYGIEGSDSIAARVREQYPELKNRLKTGDFISQKHSDMYDLVIDRSSMTHNDTSAIKLGLKNLCAAMRPGAKYIGVDWFSVEHSGFGLGERIDEYTRANITEGQFAGVGNVHFSSKEHLIELFSEAGMAIVRLEHKQIVSAIPQTMHLFASWNLVAEKV
ncbi:MAG: class I SAM-dependent methyltransferase [Gallionella sp.]|nr:class I SAM-dependent methyltransferase [Gallionella sp.]